MDVSNTLLGFYRAKVIDNKDPKKYGRVVVWVPQIMPDVDETRGLWARPGNNPVGGRNEIEDEEHHYMGSSYIPKIGSWVFVFFESGNPDNPYYFGSCDLENTEVLPENRVGENYEDKWTVIKSHEGRTVHLSDDPDDARVEITGKKRQISNPPSGDESSVYNIDGNQTTILLDEREGKEKVLIRTYQGDYIHIDINERNLQMQFENDINIKCGGQLSITVAKDIHIKSGGTIYEEAAGSSNRVAGISIFDLAGGGHHTKANKIARDGTIIQDNTGAAKEATTSLPTPPAGSRDT